MKIKGVEVEIKNKQRWSLDEHIRNELNFVFLLRTSKIGRETNLGVILGLCENLRIKIYVLT